MDTKIYNFSILVKNTMTALACCSKDGQWQSVRVKKRQGTNSSKVSILAISQLCVCRLFEDSM